MIFISSYFTPDLCRPIFFTFEQESKVEGIHGYKYVLDEGFVGNATFNSSNSCYNPHPDLVTSYPPQEDGTPNILPDGKSPFTPPTPIGEVPNMYLPNGLLNVSSCKYDSAAYVSFPHFYMADPELLDQFHPDSELNPNKDDHESYLTILPQQGIPLEVTIRMQINVLYRPITPYIPLLEHTKPIFFPGVWFEVSSGFIPFEDINSNDIKGEI